MVVDVLPELLKDIQADFEAEFGRSDIIDQAFKTLNAKKATFINANAFAIEVGRILSEALGAHLSAPSLPDGKMYYNIAQRLLSETLGRNFAIISGYATDVQSLLNEKANIHLKVQVPKINQDRIDGLVNRLSSEEHFEDVRWMVGEPIVNFSQSIIDDVIEANASFHHDVGLSPQIIRKPSGFCCKWCQEVVGTYTYPKVPKDVYRRHQHCQCTVDYHPRNGKYQNAWSKKWHKETDNKLEQRKLVGMDIRDNNRKADIREYKEIVGVLGEKAPISLAMFQNLKYNDGERYERLKDQVYILGNFKNGIWLDKVNPEKQARHIKSTARENKSYFFDDVDVNGLYEKYKSTGRVVKNKKGRTHKEQIDLPEDVLLGIDIYSGNQVNGLTIHYGKTGAHIIPTYHERK